MTTEDNLVVFYATENLLVIHNSISNFLIFIKNSKEPDVIPKTGLLELSNIYGEKLLREDVLDKLSDYIKLGKYPKKLGVICRELDTYNDDEIENHLILEVENDDLIETLDGINEEGFYTIGSYNYNTEFNKLFFSE